MVPRRAAFKGVPLPLWLDSRAPPANKAE